MMNSKIISIILTTLLLLSCSGQTYKLIASGPGQETETRFNVKHVLDGCCGCSGILINTFKNDKLQSQLFVESKEGCPFHWTKFNFHYTSDGAIFKIDTLIALSDGTIQYPITEIDKVALTKVDSFIASQTSRLYKIRKIDIKGYRDKTGADDNKLMLLPPRLSKHAIY